MNKKNIKEVFGWGIGVWLFGYVLGIILFPVVPNAIIGWIITPFGIAFSLWVLFRKINGESFFYYLKIAIIWTIIAIVFDYFFIVKAFKPADGYYKLDVYLYYLLTFIFPLAVGKIKLKKLEIIL